MGGQCFFINHSRKEIARAENDAWWDIARALAHVMREYTDWTMEDEVRFFRYEWDDHDEVRELLVEEGYSCDHADWFVTPPRKCKSVR